MSGVLDNHPHVTVAWWQFPMYNIASHIALFHIVLGMMEAILYSEQIRAVRSTVEFEDPNQKLSFWDRFLDDRVPYRPLAGCVPSVGTKDRDDCEIGCVAKAGAGEGTGSASYRTLIGPAPIPRAEQPKQKEIYQGCPSPYSVEPRQLESGALDQTLDAPQRQPSRALAKRDLRRFVLQSLAFERSGSETDRQILQDL